MELVVTIALAVLSGGIGKSLIDSLMNRNKDAAAIRSSQADANLTAVKAANEVVALYGQILADLQKEVDELKTQVASLEAALVEKDRQIETLQIQLGKG